METKVEICILAGGLSSRMGRDKAKLRVGGKTLLARIRRTASELGFPVRVIRRDLVPRCGPLGGIYTALKTTSADIVLFLACDMPNASAILLSGILEKSGGKPLFTLHAKKPGFPFVLQRAALPKVESALAEKVFSLKNLAESLRAKKFRPKGGLVSELININTPEDWERARRKMTNDQ